MPCSKESFVCNKKSKVSNKPFDPRDSKWVNFVPLANRNNMNRPFKSLVVETVYKLCTRNEELEKCGVTHKQLHTVLSLSLSRGTSPALITALIEKEINFKNIVKNKLGNYTMNPEIKDLETLLAPEEAVLDNSVQETKVNETPTPIKVDPININKRESPDTDMKGSPDKKQGSQSNDKDTEEPSGSDKMEEDEEADKPLRKPRKRRAKKLKSEEIDLTEKERSPSPNQQARKTGRSVLVTNSNGRRIIRKITKYDPSEFYLTPLIRKKNKCSNVEESKPKLKRGRPPLKAKLAAAALAPLADISSNNTTPLKKLYRIKRDQKMSKAQSSVKTPPSSPKSLPPPKLQPVAKSLQPQPKSPTPAQADEETEEEVKINTPRPPAKSSASMLKSECYLCSETANVNDELSTLACALCLNIAHNSCVIDDGFYKNLKKWRCSECLVSNPVVCSICDKEYKKSDGPMVMCDFCDEIYHTTCHIPPVKLPVSSVSWRCSLCPQLSLTDVLIGGREDLKSTVGTFAFSVNKVNAPACGGVVCIPGPRRPVAPSEPLVDSTDPPQSPAPPPSSETEPPVLSPSSPQLVSIKTEPADELDVKEEQKISVDEVEKKEASPPSYKFHRPGEPIPIVDEWTTRQVADYFADKFGPNVGNAFLNQDIDGSCLKLMRRIDVIDGLGLQFGIALKVLYYVKKIQLNTNVIKELWT